MTPFIRNDQFNFIRNQAEILINGNSSVNDKAVLKAMKSLAVDKVLNLFTEMTEEQKQLLSGVGDIKDPVEAEKFLAQIKPLVVPFKNVTDQTLRKLFPKAKKLKLSQFTEMDLDQISYLGLDDKGSGKKFLIVNLDGKLVGVHGSITPINKKGICTICNKFQELGLFMTKTKATAQGTFTNRGNYICLDSQKCNENITSMEKLTEFVTLVKG